MNYVMLKEVCSINMGQSPDSDSYNENGEGVPFFQGNADFGERYPVARKWCTAPTKMAEPEDILISVRAPIGAMNYAKEECCIGRGLAALTPDKTKVSPEFIFWLLKGKNEELNSKGTGSTFKAIGRKVLEETLVPDVGLEKQIECSEILEKVYAIIQNRKQELKKLDNLIKARFVEMFGHQSHNEKSLPYLTTDDVAEIYLGITHTPTYVENGVMFISAKNTSGDFLDLSDVKYISREEFESAPKGSKPQINDVLFSRVGSNLGHPVILEENLELCTFVSLGFLRTKGNVTSNYLKHWMRDDFFAKQVSEHVKGGGQPNLNTGWLKEFKIIVPDIECQRKFDDFCKQVDKSKFAVQKALEETQILFDSLMQEYFG